MSRRISNWTAAIRTAVQALLKADKETAIDRTIVAGYTRGPQSDEGLALATATTRAVIEEEPW